MTEEREQRIHQVIQKRQYDITLILENINDPHNISAVMRSCDAVGVSEIYVLNTIIPKHTKKWGKKSSSSASKWIDVRQYTDIQTCFEHVRKKYSTIYATAVNESSKDLYDVSINQSTAFVFGNEHSGVSKDAYQHSDEAIVIPQVGMIQSLNISVACAVTLYESFRQKRKAGHYNQTNDTFVAEKKILAQKWGIDNSSNLNAK